jgi:hypothetical protein
MIILIIGLPGAGKTALATQLAAKTNSIHINADVVRADLSSDLGFSIEDRIEQARRVGAIARLLSDQDRDVVVDFICPTKATRESFGRADKIIWVDRINKSHYEDTNAIWEDPLEYDLRIKPHLTLDQEVDFVLGRYQPWHDGHSALMSEGLKRTNQVVIAVRSSYKTSEKDPFTYPEVKQFIESKETNPFVLQFPNITNIIYGRDVGYEIEKVDLSSDLQAISATAIRSKL